MVIRETKSSFVHPSGDVPRWFRRPADSRVAELERLVRELQNALQEAHKEIARLKGETDENQFSFPKVSADGRSVLSCADVAKQEGVSLATVSRYLNADYWHGEHWGHPYKWLVYANQDFPRKSRKAV